MLHNVIYEAKRLTRAFFVVYFLVLSFRQRWMAQDES